MFLHQHCILLLAVGPKTNVHPRDKLPVNVELLHVTTLYLSFKTWFENHLFHKDFRITVTTGILASSVLLGYNCVASRALFTHFCFTYELVTLTWYGAV